MTRLLFASVVLACAFPGVAKAVPMWGYVKATALTWADSLVWPGDELTLTFAIDTEYPYQAAEPTDRDISLTTPRRSHVISGTGLNIGPSGFRGGDGGFAGPDSRMYMNIPAPGIYGDPSIVLTPEMMPTATLTYSRLGPETGYEWAHYTILQDAPISWYYGTIPEPSTYALGLLAVAALLFVRVRRK